MLKSYILSNVNTNVHLSESLITSPSISNVPLYKLNSNTNTIFGWTWQLYSCDLAHHVTRWCYDSSQKTTQNHLTWNILKTKLSAFMINHALGVKLMNLNHLGWSNILLKLTKNKATLCLTGLDICGNTSYYLKLEKRVDWDWEKNGRLLCRASVRFYYVTEAAR